MAADMEVQVVYAGAVDATLEADFASVLGASPDSSSRAHLRRLTWNAIYGKPESQGALQDIANSVVGRLPTTVTLALTFSGGG